MSILPRPWLAVNGARGIGSPEQAWLRKPRVPPWLLLLSCSFTETFPCSFRGHLPAAPSLSQALLEVDLAGCPVWTGGTCEGVNAAENLGGKNNTLNEEELKGSRQGHGCEAKAKEEAPSCA